MSQATDLIAEVKQSLTKVEKYVKNFERDIEPVGGFTDFAHLDIAKIHLRELETSLAGRRENVENELEALTAPDPAEAPAPPAETATPVVETPAPVETAPVVEAPAETPVEPAPQEPVQEQPAQEPQA